ncbi:MAG: ZIP family metal transporter [Candidatus Buchananbacteria bacterium]|nr:ZIP family metal transporter [Candidatus Buchananbacteria bacterium]
MLTLIFYSLIGGLFSLAGGLLLVWKSNIAEKFMTGLLAFAAGAFIAVGFLDMLPEAVEMVEEPHLVFIAAVIGFGLFFMLERALMRFHHHHDDHDHSEHTESLPTLVIIGDGIHNFLDGIIIALAYIANPVLGLVTTIGIAAHEIPQEIGDFGILISQGWSKKKVIMINILQSLLAIPGVIIGYYAGMFLEPYLPYLLAGTAGIFLYIAASDLIPEVHHRTSHRAFASVVAPFVVSIVLIGALIELTH